MTATLADPRQLEADWLEDQAWDEHARLAELGVDCPDDPCPDCHSLVPCPFLCGLCTERACGNHQHEERGRP